MRYDLADLEPFDCKEFELRHPDTGEGLDMHFNVLGPHTRTARMTAWNLAEYVRTAKPDAAMIDLKLVKALAAVIVDWRGVVENGLEVRYSPTRAERLLTDHHWIREQVSNFSSDRRNFFRRPEPVGEAA